MGGDVAGALVCEACECPDRVPAGGDGGKRLAPPHDTCTWATGARVTVTVEVIVEKSPGDAWLVGRVRGARKLMGA